MDPATLATIAVSILLNWAFSAITNPDVPQDAYRTVCQKRHRAEDTMEGSEILQPVYCDEIQLKNGEYLK